LAERSAEAGSCPISIHGKAHPSAPEYWGIGHFPQCANDVVRPSRTKAQESPTNPHPNSASARPVAAEIVNEFRLKCRVTMSPA